MKKILLIGGSGYIGRHLTDYLKKRDYAVAWVSRTEPLIQGVKWIQIDLELNKNIINYQPDLTIHLASSYDNSDIKSIIECNTLLPLKILEAIKLLPVDKRNLIYTGSYWQNGDFKKPHVPIDLYSASKKAFKPYIDFYHEYHNVNAIELIMFGTYGGSDNRGKLLNRLIELAKNGGSLKVSPGQQSLNLVHIDDVCSSYLIAYKLMRDAKNKLNKSFSVASEKETKVVDLIAEVESITEKVLNVSLDGEYRENEIFKPVYNDPFLPGWFEKHTLKEYIAEVFVTIK